MGVLTLTDETFDAAAVAVDEVVLVDFGADWCEPCKAMEPILEELAADYDGRLRVVRLDVDQSPAVTERLGVMSLPTLVFLRSGEVVHRLVGARGKLDMTREVDALLDPATT